MVPRVHKYTLKHTYKYANKCTARDEHSYAPSAVGDCNWKHSGMHTHAYSYIYTFIEPTREISYFSACPHNYLTMQVNIPAKTKHTHTRTYMCLYAHVIWNINSRVCVRLLSNVKNIRRYLWTVSSIRKYIIPIFMNISNPKCEKATIRNQPRDKNNNKDINKYYTCVCMLEGRLCSGAELKSWKGMRGLAETSHWVSHLLLTLWKSCWLHITANTSTKAK